MTLEFPFLQSALKAIYDSVGAVACAAADVHAPADNTAAVVTYGAVAGKRHVISGIAYSYVGGIPTGGNLQISDAGVVIFTVDIMEEGDNVIHFIPPKSNAVANSAMVITLAAGGSGITGKVSILGHWEV